MQDVDKASDVEGGENGENLLVGFRGDGANLETLSYYVLVGYHYLRYTNQLTCSWYHFQERRGRSENIQPSADQKFHL